jgi:hypothetical protein
LHPSALTVEGDIVDGEGSRSAEDAVTIHGCERVALVSAAPTTASGDVHPCS